MQYGSTPLHKAANGGYTAIAEVLLQAGADVKATAKVGSNGWVAIVSVVFSCIVRNFPIYKRDKVPNVAAWHTVVPENGKPELLILTQQCIHGASWQRTQAVDGLPLKCTKQSS